MCKSWRFCCGIETLSKAQAIYLSRQWDRWILVDLTNVPVSLVVCLSVSVSFALQSLGDDISHLTCFSVIWIYGIWLQEGRKKIYMKKTCRKLKRKLVAKKIYEFSFPQDLKWSMTKLGKIRWLNWTIEEAKSGPLQLNQRVMRDVLGEFYWNSLEIS